MGEFVDEALDEEGAEAVADRPPETERHRRQDEGVLDPDVRAIVSSGYSNDAIIANYQGHGFSAAIAKPYQMAELSDVVRRVLESTGA